MRNAPTGEQLLDTARGLLRDELIPALPPDKRHAALMIANAMAIAMRQLKNGDGYEQRESDLLAALLNGSRLVTAGPGGDPQARLSKLNRDLCRRIRAGELDEGVARAVAHRHLLAVATHKVAESNPKYLGTGQ
jgi:hypothetical protein